MNLETAFTEIQAAIAEITNAPAVVLTFRHPDEPGMTFPFMCQEWETEDRTDSGPGWVMTSDETASIAVYVYVEKVSGGDHLSLILLRWRQSIIDAIKALNAESTTYKCRVARVEQESPVNVKWAAMRLSLEVSAYDN
jgi:hypothetical protein